MKKNKTIAYALAATLLVGGTFVGTKALFTDKAEAYNDLVITMGKLDINVEEGEWKIENDNTESSNLTNNDRFTNVKPGDSFLKEVTITNDGTLDQVIDVTRGDQSGEYPDSILVGETITSELDGKTLAPGESVKAFINVNIKDTMKGDFNAEGSQNQTNSPTFNFNELVPTFNINATQTPASK
ncbi:TasA family protein [Paraclostridium bifermentans]|uniref:TasA family protein n=1 Tax=Paraclostridium bifermentans TaxID=1490 RepID=UPI002908754F|nr:TasA family protein [Paraclostridium bifermentans]MDU3337233.1 TasA family protein [Paraclostridium bifermentans]